MDRESSAIGAGPLPLLERIAARRAQAVGDPAGAEVGDQRPERGLVWAVAADRRGVVAEERLRPATSVRGIGRSIGSDPALNPAGAIFICAQVAPAVQRAHVGRGVVVGDDEAIAVRAAHAQAAGVGLGDEHIRLIGDDVIEEVVFKPNG
ncbi:MAG TPA: hypothetical protein ENN19_13810 [Chloroflexi bacterium]|nr:hypothetical protein [Chloroflexota bacterium]